MSESRHAGNGRAPLRVLVADDDRSVRDVLRLTLELEGYEVLVACDGDEALRTLRESRPDMAIVDGSMPPHDWSSVAQIRLDPELGQMPVVVVTGWEAGNGRARAERLADAVLTKPLDFEVLLATIARLLSTRHEGGRRGLTPRGAGNGTRSSRDASSSRSTRRAPRR